MNMEEIWFQTTNKIGVPKSVSENWWSTIVNAYSSEDRIYHNMENALQEKFKHLDVVKNNLRSPECLVMAIFFHHLEFDPRAYGGCVEKNVEHFKQFYKESGIDNEALLAEVTMLLHGTNHSSPDDGDDDMLSDQSYFQDLDLAVLGSSPEEYHKYTQQTEQEYANLSQHMYRNLRLKVLQTFLMIPTIYSTKEFQEKFETRARNNIKTEISLLQA